MIGPLYRFWSVRIQVSLMSTHYLFQMLYCTVTVRTTEQYELSERKYCTVQVQYSTYSTLFYYGTRTAFIGAKYSTGTVLSTVPTVPILYCTLFTVQYVRAEQFVSQQSKHTYSTRTYSTKHKQQQASKYYCTAMK